MSISAMTRVWERSQQKGSALLLLLAIADYAHDDGDGAYPSMGTLARKTRMSVRSIQYLLHQLASAGELVILKEQGPHRVHVYRLIFAPVQSLQGAKPGEPADRTLAPKPLEEPSGVTTPVEDFETEVSQSSPAPKGAKAVVVKRAGTQRPFLEEDRQRLTVKYRGQLQDVGFHIDQALNHTASNKAIDLARYVDGWLNRETKSPGGRGRGPTNSAPAPREYRTPAGRPDIPRNPMDYPKEF